MNVKNSNTEYFFEYFSSKKRVERNNVGVFERLVGPNMSVGMVLPPSSATNDNSPLYEDEEACVRIMSCGDQFRWGTRRKIERRKFEYGVLFLNIFRVKESGKEQRWGVRKVDRTEHDGRDGVTTVLGYE